MSKIIVCHNCKSILSPGSSFCSQCGARITEADYVSQSDGESNPIYLRPGTVLRMKYRINGVIGQGGFGITYDGTDIKLNMHVAIKEYFPNSMANRHATISLDVSCSDNTRSLYEQGMKNFLKEAQNMAKYAGEDNFVAVHDFFPENNTAYIIMEFVEGQNLKQYLQQHGRLTMEETMPIILPVMNALEKIHSKGMIHRDISPSNIMILPDGRVRLLDFGAAREVTLDSQTMTTMSAVYKYGYSPIEQLTNGMKQGPFTDIYALCATIYEMLTGSIPPSPFTRFYEGDSLVPPSAMGVQIYPVQEEALMRGLAVRGEDRVQSVTELRAALCGIGGADVTEERGRGILPVILAGAAAFLSVLLIIMVGGNLLTQRKKPQAGSQTIAQAGNEEEQPQEEQPQEEQPQEEPLQEEQPQEVQEEVQTPRPQTGQNAEAIQQIAQNEPESGPAGGLNVPEGATRIGNNYYKIYQLDDIRTWPMAKEYCESLGGHLAVITSDSLNDELYDLCLKNGYQTAFFGFSDTDTEGHWRWVTSAQPGYRNWGPSEPNSGNYAEDYAMFSTSEKNGTWNDSDFGYETTAFICQWGDDGIHDDEVITDIPSDAIVYRGHSYYLFDNGMTSWAEAQQYCMSRGGDMAVINDSEENEMLYRYMRDCGYGYAFFGYTDKEGEGIWRWVTADTSSFEDWGVNDDGEREPNDDHPYEDYAEFSIDLHDGYWNDSRFGWDTTAYICEWNTTP